MPRQCDDVGVLTMSAERAMRQDIKQGTNRDIKQGTNRESGAPGLVNVSFVALQATLRGECSIGLSFGFVLSVIG